MTSEMTDHDWRVWGDWLRARKEREEREAAKPAVDGRTPPSPVTADAKAPRRLVNGGLRAPHTARIRRGRRGTA